MLHGATRAVNGVTPNFLVSVILHWESTKRYVRYKVKRSVLQVDRTPYAKTLSQKQEERKQWWPYHRKRCWGRRGSWWGSRRRIMQASRGVHSAMEISCSEVLLQNRVTSTDPSRNSWLYRNEESNPKCGPAFRMVWGGLELWFTSSQVSGKVICRKVLWTFEWEFSNLTTSPYAPPPPTNRHIHIHRHTHTQ